MINKNKIKSLSLVIPCNNEQDAIGISLKVYLLSLLVFALLYFCINLRSCQIKSS